MLGGHSKLHRYSVLLPVSVVPMASLAVPACFCLPGDA